MRKTGKFIGLLAVPLVTAAISGPFTVMAATPSSTDAKNLTVTNIEANATVTAYRIVAPFYYASGASQTGLKGYSTVSGVTINDITAPTASEISTIAQNIKNGTLTGLTSVTLDDTATTGTYISTTGAGAGMWIVIVTNATAYDYSPMIVSNYYEISTESTSLTSGLLDANTSYTGAAYAKRTSKSVIDKYVLDGATKLKVKDESVTSNSATPVYTSVSYEIDTTIPAVYTSSYKNTGFSIKDVLEGGITLPESSGITVKVNGSAVTEAAGTFTITRDTAGNSYTVTFAESYALANAGKPVTINYTTALNANATSGFDSNDGVATLTYNSSTDGSTATASSTAKVYTFGLDKVNGAGNTTLELKKIISGGTTPLAGSVFTLKDTTNVNNVYTATSEADGRLVYTGLDAGTYTLVETKPTTGYSYNETLYTVTIAAIYDSATAADATTLTGYKVTVTPGSGDPVVSTYNNNGTVDENTTNIANTAVQGLPSTGGTGTVVFTIIGIGVMAGVIGIYLVSRKKKSDLGE